MGANTQRVIQQNTKEVVDFATGEIVSTETNTISQLPKEPNHVKLYLEDLSIISNVPKWATGILYSLLCYMDYNNRVVLNAGIKREIAQQQNTSVQVVNNTITKFVKANLLFRKDTGLYLFNPRLFGKGSWPNIYKIRTTLIYDEMGKHIETEVFFNEEEAV